jgi:hypothetical protein
MNINIDLKNHIIIVVKLRNDFLRKINISCIASNVIPKQKSKFQYSFNNNASLKNQNYYFCIWILIVFCLCLFCFSTINDNLYDR